MTNKEDIKIFENIFPFWNSIKADDKSRIIFSSRILSLKKGLIFYEKNDFNDLLIIKSGKIRFFIISPEGREITLYSSSKNSVEYLPDLNFNINITFFVEENTEILIVSNSTLDYFRNKYIEFEKFIHNINIEKFSKCFLALQNIIFSPVRKRILDFLTSFDKKEILITHEEIAKNLGSSREVISRNLKKMENENILKIERNKIIIL